MDNLDSPHYINQIFNYTNSTSSIINSFGKTLNTDNLKIRDLLETDIKNRKINLLNPFYISSTTPSLSPTTGSLIINDSTLISNSNIDIYGFRNEGNYNQNTMTIKKLISFGNININNVLKSNNLSSIDSSGTINIKKYINGNIKIFDLQTKQDTYINNIIGANILSNSVFIANLEFEELRANNLSSNITFVNNSLFNNIISNLIIGNVIDSNSITSNSIISNNFYGNNILNYGNITINNNWTYNDNIMNLKYLINPNITSNLFVPNIISNNIVINNLISNNINYNSIHVSNNLIANNIISNIFITSNIKISSNIFIANLGTTILSGNIYVSNTFSVSGNMFYGGNINKYKDNIIPINLLDNNANRDSGIILAYQEKNIGIFFRKNKYDDPVIGNVNNCFILGSIDNYSTKSNIIDLLDIYANSIESSSDLYIGTKTKNVVIGNGNIITNNIFVQNNITINNITTNNIITHISTGNNISGNVLITNNITFANFNGNNINSNNYISNIVTTNYFIGNNISYKNLTANNVIFNYNSKNDQFIYQIKSNTINSNIIYGNIRSNKLVSNIIITNIITGNITYGNLFVGIININSNSNIENNSYINIDNSNYLECNLPTISTPNKLTFINKYYTNPVLFKNNILTKDKLVSTYIYYNNFTNINRRSFQFNPLNKIQTIELNEKVNNIVATQNGSLVCFDTISKNYIYKLDSNYIQGNVFNKSFNDPLSSTIDIDKFGNTIIISNVANGNIYSYSNINNSYDNYINSSSSNFGFAIRYTSNIILATANNLNIYKNLSLIKTINIVNYPKFIDITNKYICIGEDNMNPNVYLYENYNNDYTLVNIIKLNNKIKKLKIGKTNDFLIINGIIKNEIYNITTNKLLFSVNNTNIYGHIDITNDGSYMYNIFNGYLSKYINNNNNTFILEDIYDMNIRGNNIIKVTDLGNYLYIADDAGNVYVYN